MTITTIVSESATILQDSAVLTLTLVSGNTASGMIAQQVVEASDALASAQDAARFSANIYQDTAIGLAATVSGDYFMTLSAVAGEYAILYANTTGVAVEQKRFPTASAMAAAIVAAADAAVSEAAAAVSEAAAAISEAAAAADAVATDADRVAAEAARDASYSAAQSSGVYIYDTKALANAAVAGLADLSIVEVLADESQSGARTRYRKESGSLVFKIALEQFLQSGAGAVPRTAQGKMRENKTLKDYGGVADYAGTPLYDGADAGRVTATDNTTAFQNLINAAIAAGHDLVRIPAGHWGIKAGNLAFSNFDRLRICGDGIGVTILDFIKEDATHSGVYVDDATAQCIASFTTGNTIEFADLTIKATTKGGLVNGAAGSNRIYEGAVWGFKLNNVKDVRLTRVRAERFNYRGFSVYGSATERVTMLHCEGFNNASTGFWVRDAASFRVTGGEFAYNGVLGENGTGYGFTAASRVGTFIVKGVYCHHNYRKGVDSHGCAEMVVKGSVFKNNVLFHIAQPNWEPPIGVSDCSTVIKGNTFSNGKLPADKAWMKACYDALATNGYTANIEATGTIVAVYDASAAGAVLNKIKTVVFEDNDVICHYNGVGDTALTVARPFLYLYANSAEVVVKNNRLNFEHAAMYAGGNVYGHIAVVLRGTITKIIGNEIKFTQLTQYTNASTSATDYGVLFELLNETAVPLDMELCDNRFNLNDVHFMAGTGVGARSPIQWTVAGSRRCVRNNVFSFLNDNYRGTNGLNDAYFLGTDATTNVALRAENNDFIRAGVRYRMPDGGQGRTASEVTYRLGAITKAIGADVFSIILDKQYSSSLRISTSDGSADLFIKIPFSSYAGITGSSGNSLLEYSSVDTALAEDGLTKLKITVKAKAALSGDYWGRITVDGSRGSLGVERVVQL